MFSSLAPWSLARFSTGWPPPFATKLPVVSRVASFVSSFIADKQPPTDIESQYFTIRPSLHPPSFNTPSTTPPPPPPTFLVSSSYTFYDTP
ncbi:uncharacterized protein BT62DRAFT_1004646 [Guyanagaster necrorhizus]|uniref:Uncharacterized protein n=1 Tax=Guyanagaster necrorhizus TaxID=856835 RepID=A0A9P8ATX4_9AGAR|nr:uncharacterized protein BT62DRAFT_1004646 [Guyanagaster necrorhizus MCA 3950]KAG7447874.1 hypothetical protein BT62DRAFT_1004646 [Guyanagaster necrorhizus MCA 3950]